jgi:transmembrane sensor
VSRTAEEAGTWDARLRAPDCTDQDRARFTAWRDADPANQQAFERLQLIVATLRHNSSRADVRALRDAALRASKQHRRRFWAGVVAASCGVIGVGATLWSSSFVHDRVNPAFARITARFKSHESYSTGIGQRSTFVLEDGSSVELDAQSKIDVAFTEHRRVVALLEGQALFNVAKTSSRPFVVSAGNREIVAIGTVFHVRLDERSVQVTLLEGKVRVEDLGSSEPNGGVMLTPGKQLTQIREDGHAEAPETAETVRDVDVAKVTGWRDGRIFLEDLSLAEAAAEMNKHSTVQIRIEGAQIEHLRVNGMFRAGDPEAFVTAVAEYFPVMVEHPSEHEILLTPRH